MRRAENVCVHAGASPYSHDPSRPRVVIELSVGERPVLDALIEGLNHAAVQAWPEWYGAEEHGDPVAHATLARVSRRAPNGDTTWFADAAQQVRAGALTVRSGVDRAGHVRATSVALGPALVIQVVTGSIDALGADAVSRAVEWLAESISDGGQVQWWVPGSALSLPGVQRFRIEDERTQSCEALGAPLAWTARFDPVVGRPHPASEGEQALYSALEGSPHLAGLFAPNARFTSVLGSRFILDLYAPSLRLAVEIDGFRHHSSVHAFSRDRQRDYELLLSGLRTLRLTHEEVMKDVEAAVEKIRRVASYIEDHESNE